MEAQRLKLHKVLKGLCPNVYYQPGDNITIDYPCIIYSKNTVHGAHANNRNYLAQPNWAVTLISRKANDRLFDDIYNIAFPVKFNNRAISDQLYHEYLTINAN